LVLALIPLSLSKPKFAIPVPPHPKPTRAAIEDAIRARAKDREARITTEAARVSELRERSLINDVYNNPLEASVVFSFALMFVLAFRWRGG
jgi:hypothetical protein